MSVGFMKKLLMTVGFMAVFSMMVIFMMNLLVVFVRVRIGMIKSVMNCVLMEMHWLNIVLFIVSMVKFVVVIKLLMMRLLMFVLIFVVG